MFDVEGPPFWPLVDHLVRQDEAAFLTDELAALVIERQVARVALGASSDFFGFFDLLCRHGLPQQRTRRLQSTTARRPRRAVRPRRARGQGPRPCPPGPAVGSGCSARRRLARGRTRI